MCHDIHQLTNLLRSKDRKKAAFTNEADVDFMEHDRQHLRKHMRVLFDLVRYLPTYLVYASWPYYLRYLLRVKYLHSVLIELFTIFI